MTPRRAIVHHSLTKDSKTVSWSAIRYYHIYHNGWDNIGYHYGIELVGSNYEVLVGRPENVQGAHCYGHNLDSLGICFIGNFDLVPPSDPMMERAVEVFAPIIVRLGIPFSRIYEHHLFDPRKTCPGTAFPFTQFVVALAAGKWK